MNYDTYISTEPERDRPQVAARRALFPSSCDGLVTAVRHAADPSLVGGWEGRTRVGDAVWLAKHVMREARALGLYPSTAQLEAETRMVA